MLGERAGARWDGWTATNAAFLTQVMRARRGAALAALLATLVAVCWSSASARSIAVGAAVSSVEGGAAPAALPLDGPTSQERTGASAGQQRAGGAVPPLVVLDPGHGGEEIGAAAYGVVEKDSNLDMALRTERYLREAGVEVLLTRRNGGRAPAAGTVYTTGFSATRADLQTRVHMANEAGAAVFVSIHSNGSPDLGQRGIEVYYDSRRAFGDANANLAQTLLDSMLAAMADARYPSADRGIKDSACWRSFSGRCVGLFLLSPEGAATAQPGGATNEATKMPGALVELLFISSPSDAALLQTDAARDALARGLAAGILVFLGH